MGIIGLICLIAFSDIQLVEKVEKKQESIDFGVIEETKEESMEEEKENKEETEKNSESENSESEEIEESEEEKEITKTINGIVFKLKETSTQVYATEDTALYINPEKEDKNLKNQEKKDILMGEPLNLWGFSEDSKWAMVRLGEDTFTYLHSEYISFDYVRPVTIVVVQEESKDESKKEESKKEESKKEESKKEELKKEESKKEESKTQSSSKQESTTKPEAPKPTTSVSVSSTTIVTSTNPGYTTDGVPFPENPAATSINLGINFADVDMVMKITYDSITANSGPGKATTSTGYTALSTFMRGDTVAITGIGENGYCRVELGNGEVAFIDGKYLE